MIELLDVGGPNQVGVLTLRPWHYVKLVLQQKMRLRILAWNHVYIRVKRDHVRMI